MLIVGIMSDSHDNLTAIDLAIETFRAEPKVNLIVHCGDFCSPFAFRGLQSLDIPLKAVIGNNDGEQFVIRNIFDARPDWELERYLFELEIDEQKAVVVHGDVPKLTELLLRAGEYDWIFSGHTHEPKVDSHGKTTLINPGETSGWLSGKGTVAKVDTAAKSPLIIELFTRD
ncbi:MAG: metallophosphoesterase [Candidatus Hodarchaeales archaeon]|jgi:putative phosphoesterase